MLSFLDGIKFLWGLLTLFSLAIIIFALQENMFPKDIDFPDSNKSIDKKEKYYLTSISIVDKIKYSESLGLLYKNNLQYTKSIKYYTEALKNYKILVSKNSEYNTSIVKTTIQLANLYKSRDSRFSSQYRHSISYTKTIYKETEEFYITALELVKKLKMKHEEAIIYSYLGSLYRDNKNKSIEMYFKALPIFNNLDKDDKSQGFLDTLYQVALFYQFEKQYTKAEKLYIQILKIYDSKKLPKLRVLENLAFVYYKLNKNQKVKDIISQSKKLYISSSKNRNLPYHLKLASEKSYIEVIEFWTSMYEKESSSSYCQLKKIKMLSSLATLYKNNDKDRKAVETYKKAIEQYQYLSYDDRNKNKKLIHRMYYSLIKTYTDRSGFSFTSRYSNIVQRYLNKFYIYTDEDKYKVLEGYYHNALILYNSSDEKHDIYRILLYELGLLYLYNDKFKEGKELHLELIDFLSNKKTITKSDYITGINTYLNLIEISLNGNSAETEKIYDELFSFMKNKNTTGLQDKNATSMYTAILIDAYHVNKNEKYKIEANNILLEKNQNIYSAQYISSLLDDDENNNDLEDIILYILACMIILFTIVMYIEDKSLLDLFISFSYFIFFATVLLLTAILMNMTSDIIWKVISDIIFSNFYVALMSLILIAIQMLILLYTIYLFIKNKPINSFFIYTIFYDIVFVFFLITYHYKINLFWIYLFSLIWGMIIIVLYLKKYRPIPLWLFLLFNFPLGIVIYIKRYKSKKIYKILKKPRSFLDLDLKELKSTKDKLKTINVWEHILKSNYLNNKQMDIALSFSKKPNVIAFASKLEATFMEEENFFRIRFSSNKLDLEMDNFLLYLTDKSAETIKKELQHRDDKIFVISKEEYQDEIALLAKDKTNRIIAPTSRQLSMLFLHSDAQSILMEILSDTLSFKYLSPYQTNGGVKNESNFFGRVETIRDIITSDNKNYLIVGARQLGKTSIIKALERRYNDSETVNCYSITLDETGDVLRDMSLVLELSKTSTLEDIAKRIRADEKRVVFLIDEADKFMMYEKDNDYIITSMFRKLSEEGKATFIFAGFWTLYQYVTLDYQSPLKNFGELIRLEGLDDEACRDLMIEPMKRIGVKYADESIISEVIELCGNRANLIAIVCNEVLKKLESRVIVRDDIDKIIDDNKLYDYMQDWGNMSSDDFRNQLNRVVVYLTIEKESFRLGDVINLIKEKGLTIDPTKINESLDQLSLAYVLKKSQGSYSYIIPLFKKMLLDDDIEFLLDEEILKLK